MDSKEKLAKGIIEKTKKGVIVWRLAEPNASEQERNTDKKYEAFYGDMRLAVGHEMLAWPIDNWTQCFLKIADEEEEIVFCQKNMSSAPITHLFRAIDGFCQSKPEKQKESIQKLSARDRLTKKLLELLE